MKYYMVGKRPVSFEETPGGEVRIMAWNSYYRWLEPSPQHWSVIDRDRDGRVKEITREEFEEACR